MDIVKRLRGFIDQRGPDDCWPWKGKPTPNGYGRFMVRKADGKQEGTTAHRAVVMYLQGVNLSKDVEVCHTCDNRICVNPAHLYVGTPKSNAADKVAKNRQARFPGELNQSAKLTRQDVEKVRESADSHRQVARNFGVSESLVRQIRKREIWHV